MRVALVSIFLTVVLSSGIAQKISLGGKIGIGLSGVLLKEKMGTNLFYSTTELSSFALNAVASKKLTSFLELSIEPGLIRKGYKSVLLTRTENDVVRLTQVQAQLPILMKIYLRDNIHVDMGYEYSYVLEAISSDRAYSSLNESSINLGLGYGVNKQIDIGLRYGQSISSSNGIMFSNVDGWITGSAKEINSYAHLYVMYKFNRLKETVSIN